MTVTPRTCNRITASQCKTTVFCLPQKICLLRIAREPLPFMSDIIGFTCPTFRRARSIEGDSHNINYRCEDVSISALKFAKGLFLFKIIIKFFFQPFIMNFFNKVFHNLKCSPGFNFSYDQIISPLFFYFFKFFFPKFGIPK